MSFEFIGRFILSISNSSLPQLLKQILLVSAECLFNFFHRREKIYIPDLNIKKNVIITGGNRGIGLEVTIKLLKHGYNVHVLSRNPIDDPRIDLKYKIIKCFYGDAKISKIIYEKKLNQNIGRLIWSYLDLNDIRNINISDIVFKHIDYLLCNAGIMDRNESDLNIVVNHLGHLKLVESLKSRLINARIVFTTSCVMFSVKKYTDSCLFLNGYCQSKLCNSLMAFYYKHSGLKTVAVHPGIINTGLFKGVYVLPIKILSMILPRCLNTVNEGSDSLINAMFSSISEDFDLFFGIYKISPPDYVNINEAEVVFLESINQIRKMEI